MSDVISTAQPRYAQIKEAIRRRISSGDWPEGFQIPSEHKLLEEFSVSRMTVHRALRDLTDEGLLTRVQGLGTFVAERPPSTDVVELRSIADEIAERGNVHACRVERLLAVAADAGLARRFNLPVGAKLFHSVVVHSESDVPVQLEERWVNPAVAPDYLDQDFTRQTPGEYLIRLEASPQVEHVIEAVSPTAEIARLLDIPVTEPCLRVTRRTWVQGRVVTVAMLVHPGSRYRLGARFQLPPP
ncbi:histidine utilization repressor (plasmid) [Azospirillum oryzae]|uniref:Histidine utilization repressor n=1 Tax=Azospirillum oryzae TaxID=286727 RepID=A0A6N1ADG5_9PROT|nr:histidine utilization repressor [Azospirillum oryzae]KAA0588177.1 histidine utilization repressor [Azospirillum oryzae]QKS49219.1 histidine utilization repressor [Azospirillum oryzae]GLR82022.1 histidine utilization repressor [Azospirillum oryzae]